MVRAGGILAVVAVVVGVVIFGMNGGTREVVIDPHPVIPPPESGAAVIAALRQSGGRSLLGIRISDNKHYAEVEFLTGPGCSGRLRSGDAWPTGYAQCRSQVKVVGRVSGLGITASGASLVGVEFEVTRWCFELLKPGMAWPPALPENAPLGSPS
jgi:hypothetical protein